MRKFIFVCFGLLSVSMFGQGTFNISAQNSSGSGIPGLAAFFYSSTSHFLNGGTWQNPDYGNFDTIAYTDANGNLSLPLTSSNPGDTVYWAVPKSRVFSSWPREWTSGSAIVTAAGANSTIVLSAIEIPDLHEAFVVATFDTINSALKCEPYLLRDSNLITPPGPFLDMVSIYAYTDTSYSHQYFLMEDASKKLFYFLPGTHLINRSIASTFVDYYPYFEDSVTSNRSEIQLGGAVTIPNGSTAKLINLPYLKNAPWNWNIIDNAKVSFRDSSYTNGTIINYEIDYGDGTHLVSPTIPAPHTHHYNDVGNQDVRVKVTSVLGSDTSTVTALSEAFIRCFSNYLVDTVNSGLFQNQLVIWENSRSAYPMGTYHWDFGDGTTSNAQYPSHTYSQGGVYNVCLTTKSIYQGANGFSDTCVSTYCDSIGFDANGDLVYKNGFTINVIDPSTVGVSENPLAKSLTLFPNPAQERALLSWDSELEVSKISVLNSSGQFVQEVSIGEGRAEIKGLSSGVYIVRVESQKGLSSRRLIIQ